MNFEKRAVTKICFFYKQMPRESFNIGLLLLYHNLKRRPHDDFLLFVPLVIRNRNGMLQFSNRGNKGREFSAAVKPMQVKLASCQSIFNHFSLSSLKKLATFLMFLIAS